MGKKLIAIEAPQPYLAITWQVNNYCNFKCSYCNPGNWGGTDINDGNLDLYIRTRLIGLNMILALAKKNPKHCVYFVLGVSQSKYNEEFFIDGKNSSCNTSDLILTYGFKYDKRIGKHLALSSGIILNQAAVRYVLANENLLQNNGTLLGGERVDFGKINFSLGLRYYLGRKF